MRGLERFYAVLLHLYPSGFRTEYRRALTDTFLARMRERSGPALTVRGVLAAIADVVPNAAAVHWEILRQDLRYAGRSLRSTPGFAATAIVVVALGVGANTAAFSLADFVLIKPLDFPEPDRLVRLWESTPGYSRMEFSPANYRDVKAASRSFTGMAAFSDRSWNLVGSGEPRRLNVGIVTPELMPLLGVPALAGRVISPADSVNEQVIVLSYGLWQTQFGADPRIIGSVLRLDDMPYTVIGVMPPSFAFPARDVEAWTPLVLTEVFFSSRTDNFLGVVARLRPGETLERASAEAARIAARLEQQYPKDNEGTSALAVSLRDELSQRARLLVIALVGAALCILLLACANLASLLLARATHRTRELAVRAALGAGRERLVRQLVTESLGLAVIGGTLGVAIATAGVPLLAQLVPDALPVNSQPTVDGRVLAVAGIVVVLTGLAFGIAPAIAAGRSKALDALRGGARGGLRTQRLRAVLVTVEVAACVVLLVCSGLLIRAVMRIQATDPGFRAEGLLTLRTELPTAKAMLGERRLPFFDRVLDDVRALPGVQHAAYMSGLPMVMRGGIWPATVVGDAVIREASNSVGLRFVTPDYFAAMGIPLRAGRDISTSDRRDSPPVAVVSESFARRMWPNESAIGKRFTIVTTPRTIVGVVGDVHQNGPANNVTDEIYLPYLTNPSRDLRVLVRSSGPPGTLATPLRNAVRELDDKQPIVQVQTLDELRGTRLAEPRVTTALLFAFAVVALVITAGGLVGVVGYSVTQRVAEIGIRVALGADAVQVLWLLLRAGILVISVGLVIGAFAALGVTRLIRGLLFTVTATDPLTYAGVALALLGIGIVACFVPARRAMLIDPVQALRSR